MTPVDGDDFIVTACLRPATDGSGRPCGAVVASKDLREFAALLVAHDLDTHGIRHPVNVDALVDQAEAQAADEARRGR